MSDQKIIIIRKGINGFSFAICNSKGNWIGNANSIHSAFKVLIILIHNITSKIIIDKLKSPLEKGDGIRIAEQSVSEGV